MCILKFLEKYAEFQSQIRSHILTFTYVKFPNRTNCNLKFSSELPPLQASQVAGTLTAHYAIIPWPPVKNVYSEIAGREKWVIVVNVLKSEGTPEVKVTHFGQVSSSGIPEEILHWFEQELISIANGNMR